MRIVKGWEILLDKIASNAFYDSGARFDSPKCDEDTRVEVTGEIMDWMNDRDGPQRLLCMTGAAGAGKSALQQTIAERCAQSGILGCAFFFSSQDPTRNDISRIIPTIAYQLGIRNRNLRCHRESERRFYFVYKDRPPAHPLYSTICLSSAQTRFHDFLLQQYRGRDYDMLQVTESFSVTEWR